MIDFGTVGLTGEDPAGSAKQFKMPAAVGGLNKRDSLADMPETDANILINMFPRPNYVELRRGYESYATGIAGAVETLMEWGGPASKKFFAAASTVIYDITSSGVASSSLTGQTNARWQYVNFTTSGGNFLLCVNGSDSPVNYNGSSWSTSPAITGSGLTASNLIGVTAWKSRLWFVEKNTTNAWYLPVNSIGGAASKLDLGSQFEMGGYLEAIGTASGNAGDGVDEYLVFMSSVGEIVVYQGTDPSQASTFSRVARFVVGAPIGRRCMINVAGDLAIITLDGVISLIKAMGLDRSAIQQAAITNKIQNLFNQYAYDYSSNFGWQGQIYPRGSCVLFNVPFSSTQYVQLVMNTNTGSWCQYENMNGSCWGMYNDDIYFGVDGIVYKADTTRQDNGGNISFDYQSAWSDYGSSGNVKLFQEGVSLINSNGSPALLQAFNVDFETTDPTGTLNPTAPPTSTWDSGLWDSAKWGGTNAFYQWFSIGAIGTWGAIRIKGAASGISLQINAYTITADIGGAH